MKLYQVTARRSPNELIWINAAPSSLASSHSLISHCKEHYADLYGYVITEIELLPSGHADLTRQTIVYNENAEVTA